MYRGERTRQGRDSRSVSLQRLSAAAAVLVACLAAGSAQAQSGKGDYVGAWSVSGSVGYATPNPDAYGDSFVWRLGVGYSPLPQFEIGLELGRFISEVSQPEPGGVPNHDIASGTLEVRPVCLALQYHLPLAETMATVNLLAGVGYYFIDYTMADTPLEIFAATGVEGLPDQRVHNSFGFHAGAGLEYALTGWFSVTIEGRYLILAPRVSGTAKDDYTLGGSLDLNTWLFTGGIRVAF